MDRAISQTLRANIDAAEPPVVRAPQDLRPAREALVPDEAARLMAERAGEMASYGIDRVMAR